jgi:hypothetical protein
VTSRSLLLRGPASLDAVLELVERLLAGSWWVPRAVGLSWLLALFFSVPGYERTPDLMDAWARGQRSVVARTIEHPLTDLARLYPERSNAAKRTFRLTAPGVAIATGSGVAGAFVFGGVCAYAVLHFATQLGHSLLGRRSYAWLLTLLLSASYFGSAAMKDLIGWFDSVAFAYLFAAMLARAPAWRALALLAAFFTDERAILVSPFLLGVPLPESGRLSARARAAELSLALAAYAALRLALSSAFGLSLATLGVGSANLSLHSQRYLPGLWSAFEGGWLVFAAGLLVLLRSGGRTALVTAAAGLYLALYLGSCFLVIDATRSLGYAYVALPALLAALRGRMAVAGQVRLLALAAAISLLVPNLFLWDLLDYELSLPLWLLRG